MVEKVRGEYRVRRYNRLKKLGVSTGSDATIPPPLINKAIYAKIASKPEPEGHRISRKQTPVNLI